MSGVIDDERVFWGEVFSFEERFAVSKRSGSCNIVVGKYCIKMIQNVDEGRHIQQPVLCTSCFPGPFLVGTDTPRLCDLVVWPTLIFINDLGPAALGWDVSGEIWTSKRPFLKQHYDAMWADAKIAAVGEECRGWLTQAFQPGVEGGRTAVIRASLVETE